MKNPHAGIGDPYWYEWSVGLSRALDMLNQDNGIKHVILQAGKLQGLDDVIVVYSSGQAECLQIKHTREKDTLTFSDMVYASDEKESYLRRFCKDWLEAEKQGLSSCKAVLFTNRDMGKRKNTPAESWERPALEDFWTEIRSKLKGATSICDISVKTEWQAAWRQWIAEMSDLTDEQKYTFLLGFEIMANQDDLNEIIHSIAAKLAQYFKTEEHIGIQLHQKLCYALMTWSTTLRAREEITKEDLLAALSLSSDQIVGEHHFPTCEPFFESRVEFAKNLEDVLRIRKAPIVFLSGEPGCGKTNLVNYLSNKNDSVIALRFHAFKPLTSKDLYLPADRGISDPRALWGNLLIELREQLVGNLSKYQVPVSNELLRSVDEIRDEVMRLSSALALEVGAVTVIAIDGIDHAARTGENNTFLRTLIPPEGVPQNVCFLIAGQPIHQYDDYPDWLSDHQRVCMVEVPHLEEDDVRQLYDSANVEIPKDSMDAAIKLISRTVAGNTLAAIFAVHEAKKCNDIEELERLLDSKQLSSGISAYYEYIWKSAKSNIPSQFFYIDNILAGVLSLVNKRITAATMTAICNDTNVSEAAWERVMQTLYPIVISTNGEYGVFHNDVRIYLEKYIRKDIAAFAAVAGKLADYFMLDNSDIRIKHELLFKLLSYAKRENEFVDVFTKHFVFEALKIRRPMTEITEQLKEVLKSLSLGGNITKIPIVNCAVQTLYQFNQSLQWVSRQYCAETELPVALNSEKKPIRRNLLTAATLEQLLRDTRQLVEHDEISRAKTNITRCLGKSTPEDIMALLASNNGTTSSDDKTALESWGRLAQYIGFEFEKTINREVADAESARAHFARGWLEEGQLLLDEKSVTKTLNELTYYFTEDVESYLHAVIDNNNVDQILEIPRELVISNYLKLRLIVFYLFRGDSEFCKDWSDDVLSKRFGYVESVSANSRKENFSVYVLILFVLSYFKGNKYKRIVDECLIALMDEDPPKDRVYYSAKRLLVSASYIAFMCRNISLNSANLIKPTDYAECINQLLDKRDLIGKYEINGNNTEGFLLTHIIDITNSLDSSYRNLLTSIISDRTRSYEDIEHLGIRWNYLKDNGQISILEELFDCWMLRDGLCWKKELADSVEVAEDFISKAAELGWTQKASEAQTLFDNRLIGYVGRKEYSMYSLLRLYQRISHINNEHWHTRGVKMLNISQIVSDTGDNRAAIYVSAAVAESAGRLGAKSLWCFANLEHAWNAQWIQTVFDGVIAGLESGTFSRDELISLWTVSSEVFFVLEDPERYDSHNTLRSIYIADIKEALLRAAKRHQFDDIEDSMRKISALAFAQVRNPDRYQSFMIPTRWFDHAYPANVETFLKIAGSLSCADTLTLIEGEYKNDRDNFRWDHVVELVRKVEADSGEDISNYMPRIIDLLSLRNNANSWEWDGANRLYEVILKYFGTTQVNGVVEDILTRYSDTNSFSDESRLYGLSSDLDNFTYSYYGKLSEVENVRLLEGLIEMHTFWITGNGSIPLPTYFQGSESPSSVSGWKDFCRELRIRL